MVFDQAFESQFFARLALHPDLIHGSLMSEMLRSSYCLRMEAEDGLCRTCWGFDGFWLGVLSCCWKAICVASRALAAARASAALEEVVTRLSISVQSLWQAADPLTLFALVSAGVSFVAFSSQLCSLQGNRSGAPHHQRLGHVVPSDRRMRAFSIHRKMLSPRQFEVPGGVASHTHS